LIYARPYSYHAASELPDDDSAENSFRSRSRSPQFALANNGFGDDELGELSVGRTGLEAIPAVNRLIASRLERNLRDAATLAASGFEHLALSAAAATAAALRAAGLAGGAAIGATVRFIGEALHCEELLLAGRERELASAIDAREHFGRIHET
jgi:hypothetical protein